ncbi:mechanosensitive ion channel family protein [Aquabacterium parvum]|uniref:mechanosensitive ion channel family protein n=1 Tax=Aquabacterium parvum TaxID=70584 RepID=UPI0009FA82E4|nr:mechanosensitive ion channel family protein [Aquabacterium parvum]
MRPQPLTRTGLFSLILGLAFGLGATLATVAPTPAQAKPHHAASHASTPATHGASQPAAANTAPNAGANTTRPPEAVIEEPATLHVANRPILTLQTAFLGMTPEERVRRASHNIDQALAAGGPGRVTTRSTPEGELIFIDGVMTIVLHAADADPLLGDTLASLMDRTVAALNLAIRETQEGRDTRSLLISLAWVLGATTVAAALLWALGHLRDAALRLLERFLDTKTRKLADAQVLRRGRVRQAVGHLDTALSWGLGLLVAYGWLSFSLQQFPYTRPWGEGLRRFLVNAVLELGSGVVNAVPGLVVAGLILLLARAVVGALARVFHRVETGHLTLSWLRPDAATPTRRVASWVIWIFALAMAYPYLPGAETEAFKGMSVLVGLMLSLGASSFVAQVAAGLILTYSNTLRKGEYVRVGEHEGTVLEVGAFNTRIRTGLGEEIVLPNNIIASSATKNYSREVQGPGYIVDTVVTIGYDTPWRQVEAMLIEAARRTPGVLDTPAPRVYQTALSDWYPEYRLVAQAIPDQPRPRAEVLSALHANIQDVFNENGVQIMSPHYMLDPTEPKVVPQAKWHTPLAQGPKA